MTEVKSKLTGAVWWWLNLGLKALGVLVAAPLLLVPLYIFVNPTSAPMVARQVSGLPVEQIWRPIEQISDRLKVSVMLSEDGQFCRHWGVDLSALKVEIEAVLAGRDARGASTISMQVARNLFLWRGRSFVRKGLEVPLAMYLDLILSKRRIMEIYLNIAEWGPGGQFGIEAGAQRAFGIDAGALTWEKASLLAVTLPNPLVRYPGAANAGLIRVSQIVTQRAKQYSDRTECLFEGPVPALD